MLAELLKGYKQYIFGRTRNNRLDFGDDQHVRTRVYMCASVSRQPRPDLDIGCWGTPDSVDPSEIKIHCVSNLRIENRPLHVIIELTIYAYIRLNR